MRDQVRWFGGMVGNHVADMVSATATRATHPPGAHRLHQGPQGYDYNQHGQAGNTHADFVPDEIVDRFCILGPPAEQIRRLEELRDLGVDQFAIYLQHDAKDHTLLEYGERVIPHLRDARLAKT
jgi:alkanesulfonate monooxygenase SsuD/methylene tetrahydromethanopterin reductase-like flavin-dependent oxidoreductase (luciferase family)